jgi:hypothetical protein
VIIGRGIIRKAVCMLQGVLRGGLPRAAAEDQAVWNGMCP